MENNAKRKYELFFLEYHLKNYNVKFITVIRNNDLVLPTKVVFYNAVKRKMKYQPVAGEITLCGMFNQLKEKTFYSVPKLIKEYKE